jgi:hypothetical protein
MKGQTLTNILGELHRCNDEDALNKIYELARQRRDSVRNANANRIGWAVGQKVQLKPEHQNSRPYDEIGTVEKVNPKKLHIDFNGVKWNVPKTMVVQV